jgi:hypothetical protein
MSDEPRPIRTTEPHDRLTRICAAMTDALDAHPESDDTVRCAVFLDDGKRGGIQLHGYDDDIAAFVDIFLHLRAILRANGKDLDFIGIPDDASGLDR